MMKCICNNNLGIEKKFSNNFKILECVSCGSQFFENKNEIIQFQYNDQNEKYQDDHYLENGEFRWAHLEIEKILKRDFIGSKIHEMGCFNGFYVNHIHQKYNLDISGSDINESAISTGKRNYPEIKEKIEVATKKLANRKYDVIILIDVFEHLAEPKEFVKELYEMLNQNGKIILSGPTKERLFFDKTDKPPHHTWRYTSKGMIKFFQLNKFNLKEIHIEHNGYLAFRNFMGLILSGLPKEYYGKNTPFKGKGKNTFIKILEVPIKGILNSIFKMFKIQYCSQLMIYEKV